MAYNGWYQVLDITNAELPAITSLEIQQWQGDIRQLTHVVCIFAPGETPVS